MAYTIKVNHEKCTGCGVCVSISPSSFEMKGDKSHPKKDKVDALSHKEKEAEESCPTQAITIEED